VRLRVDRGGEVHHHLVVVVVELVLGLLGHGERAGQRDLRLALGVARRNAMSPTSTAWRRRILPMTRGTLTERPARFVIVAGVRYRCPRARWQSDWSSSPGASRHR